MELYFSRWTQRRYRDCEHHFRPSQEGSRGSGLYGRGDCRTYGGWGGRSRIGSGRLRASEEIKRQQPRPQGEGAFDCGQALNFSRSRVKALCRQVSFFADVTILRLKRNVGRQRKRLPSMLTIKLHPLRSLQSPAVCIISVLFSITTQLALPLDLSE